MKRHAHLYLECYYDDGWPSRTAEEILFSATESLKRPDSCLMHLMPLKRALATFATCLSVRTA